MILKTLYKEVRRVYNSIFRPPNVDLGFARREKISIVYAVSAFSLFVYTTFKIFKKSEDPAYVEKATLKPPPDAKHINIIFDAKKFTLSRKIEENKDVDKEENSS